MSDSWSLIAYLRKLSADEVAKFTASALAPGFVLLIASSPIWSPPLTLDLGQPFSITQLRTEMTEGGSVTQKFGVAVVVEPAHADFRIPITQTGDSLWLSLEADKVRANADRLEISSDGVAIRPPFVGVGEPVTMVVEGRLGHSIDVPGGSEAVVRWKPQSRRSTSLVSSVLFCCVFAFGMALVYGLPPRNDQDG